MAENRISLGVSSCLLGHKVRYDGDDKLNAIIEKDICTQFHCIPLCPEYAVGLGVPRNPVQLVQTNDSIHVLSVSDRSLNITALLQQYADFVSTALPQLSGYIFKARSPSCGLTDTPIHDSNNRVIGTGRGMYAGQITHRNNTLPVIDEIQLADPARRREFIRRVQSYCLQLERC
ncbi:MAG: 2-thiouracil desulfurase family protein [Gammaproteobacteria bacterium]